MRVTTTITFILLSLISISAKPPAEWERALPAVNKSLRDRADATLNDTFTLQGVTGSPVNREHSGYNWNHGGPKNDKEWAWFLNRHRYFEVLYVAYQETKDPRYAQKIFQILADWIEQNKTPPSMMSFSSAWRPLEAARRVLESWDLIYLKLWDDPNFPPELKPDFIEAFENHGDYLQDHHALFGNHLITEMLALLKLSLLLPDSKNSAEWKRYALKTLDREYHKQVYPEGAHKELSSHYQRVVLVNFQSLLSLLEIAEESEQIKIWKPRIEGMWHYFKAIQKPSGFAPLNNDSDQENVAAFFPDSLRAQKPNDAAVFDAEGKYFPNAGQVIFRDPSIESGPLWAFFDIGPRGTDHQHEDFLHLSLSFGDFDILVDNGRYTYTPGPWRDYFQGPRSHNILLVDATTTEAKPKLASGPLHGSGFIQRNGYTAAWGESGFRNKYGAETARWQRSVVGIDGIGLLVLDHLITFQDRKLSGFWHSSPDTTAHLTPSSVQFANEHHSVTLSYQNTLSYQLNRVLESGKKAPEVQGWHSLRFNKKVPAPCLSYEVSISKPTIFAWLFSPDSTGYTLQSLTQKSGQLHLQIAHPQNTLGLIIQLPKHPDPLTLSFQ